MALVAGVDSSTQSTKVEVRNLDTGEIVASGSAPHPPVQAPCSEQDPESWWSAFGLAWDAAGSPRVEAISIGGQQHGMVALDDAGSAVHPAKLWNDTESSADADALVERHGAEALAQHVGSVPVAAFTLTKLAWLHRTRPEAAQQLAHVLLPHDYLTHRLTDEYTTDRGDASGTAYWSPSTGTYAWDLLAEIDPDRAWESTVPTVLDPLDAAGEWHGALVAPGTGDNMAAALGVGLTPGDAVISIGTSGTVYAVSATPATDPTGAVAGFAAAPGRFLPLVCTSNAAKVLDTVRRLLDVDHATFDELALDAALEGPVLLPYLDGERTPNRPDASGVLAGIRTDTTRAQLARAAVDGVACGLLDGMDALRNWTEVSGRVVLVGGGARSDAMQRVLAGMLGGEAVASTVDEAVATGAAVQAAAVLEQVDHAVIQERWGLGDGSPVEGIDVGDVRDRYAALRDA